MKLRTSKGTKGKVSDNARDVPAHAAAYGHAHAPAHGHAPVSSNTAKALKRSLDAQDVLCDHCGAVCSGAGVAAGGHTFCCTGCKLVHELLRSDAVCDVVGNDAVSRERFTRIGIPRFAFLDHPETAAGFLNFRDARVSRCELKLPSIHCASCVWTLENLHRIDAAVIRSEVNFLKRTLHVSFLHDELSFRQLVELCTRLGYEPDLRREGADEHTRTHTMRSLYMKLGVAGFAFGNAMIFSAPDYLASFHGDLRALTPAFVWLFAALRIALSIPVLLYSASDYFLNSWSALRNRSMSLDVPVAMGLLALFVRSMVDIALGAGTGYLDSFTGLVFFLLTARLIQTKSFQALAFDRTFVSFFPISAGVEDAGGAVRSVPLSQLREGNIVRVRHGEIIPADAILLDDHAHVDYSFVTGEAEISEVLKGARVFAGGKVAGAELRCELTATASHSYLTQLWNESTFHRRKHQRAEKISEVFALAFTLTVIVVSIATALWWWPNASMALSAAVAVLIVACPCALTLAAPFTYGAAMSILGRGALYLRSAGVVAELSAVDTIVFDKTGTLTNASATDNANASAAGDTQQVLFRGTHLTDEEHLLVLASVRSSHHPLSKAAAAYLQNTLPTSAEDLRLRVRRFAETPGQGIECRIDGHHIRIGSEHFVNQCSDGFKDSKGCIDSEGREYNGELEARSNAQVDHVDGGNHANHVNRGDDAGDDAVSTLYLHIDGRRRGKFLVQSALRPGICEMLIGLRKRYRVYVLSGDSERHTSLFNGLVDPQNLLFNKQPIDKLRCIEELQRNGAKVLMVGDGVNDAGALRQAHCGIAVSEESGAFTPASDAILSGSALYRLPLMLRLAQSAHKVLVLAFAVSVVYNMIGLAMACNGHLTPVFAAFFMPLSSWSVVGIAYGLMKLIARKESRSWSGATGAKVNSVKQHHDGTLPAPFTYAS
jgi:Cu+-exporting ATPase